MRTGSAVVSTAAFGVAEGLRGFERELGRPRDRIEN
jgi:hypothetical protein